MRDERYMGDEPRRGRPLCNERWRMKTRDASVQLMRLFSKVLVTWVEKRTEIIIVCEHKS